MICPMVFALILINMQTLEILFIAIMIVAIIVAIKFFFSVKQDQEYTITLNIESEDLAPLVPEPVAKPKRRYKRRKKKVVASPVSSPVTPPVAEVVPAVKKAVGRPKKNA